MQDPWTSINGVAVKMSRPEPTRETLCATDGRLGIAGAIWRIEYHE